MKIFKRSEHDEQVSLFKRAKLLQNLYPELVMLYAVPNAAKRSTNGGSYMKAEGLKSGIPDVNLPVPKGEFAGFWVELKVPGGRLKQNQMFWLNMLNDSGSFAVCCYGEIEAFGLMEKYLNEANGLDQYKVKYRIDRKKFGKKTGLDKKYQATAMKMGYCDG